MELSCVTAKSIVKNAMGMTKAPMVRLPYFFSIAR